MHRTPIYTQGIIIETPNCVQLKKQGKTSISFRTTDSHLIKGKITSHTRIMNVNLTHGQCEDLALYQTVHIGYAEGNDSSSFTHSFNIIDSITSTH